jgi:hypothetical protein
MENEPTPLESGKETGGGWGGLLRSFFESWAYFGGVIQPWQLPEDEKTDDTKGDEK